MDRLLSDLDLPPPAVEGVEVYGGAARMWRSRAPEVILSGPAETGKTFAWLSRLDVLARRFAGARMLMVRKTYQSLKTSVVVAFEDKILPLHERDLDSRHRVRKYGGINPLRFDYPGGSRITLGGMDNPAKVLSAEYDLIYVNQAEELTLDDWETLSTRATGRAGNMPFAQLGGDCNPGPPGHWILQREKEGALIRYESRHEDNPVLWDRKKGVWTVQGEHSLSVLDRLTGARRQRLRFGKWVQAEGAVYESYDAAVHLIDRFEIPRHWRRVRVVDFGYVHPFVCQWWALDEDGRAFRYREIYMTGRTVAEHAQQINRLSKDEAIEATLCDHDAEDRETLRQNGIPNKPAYKDVMRGLQAVEDRWKKAGDGRPRLFLLRDSLVERDRSLIEAKRPTCTEEEIDGYVWGNHATKERPVKENDHGCDAVRYFVAWADRLHLVSTSPPAARSAPVRRSTDSLINRFKA